MLISWFFSVVMGLLFIFGLVFAFTDMRSLPVSNEAVLPWVTGMLGATMMGWALTGLLVGRYGFHRNEKQLLKIVLYGVLVWFIADTAFSAYLGVYFNVVVNALILLAVLYPLGRGIRQSGRTSVGRESNS